jgi:hypothetical protein
MVDYESLRGLDDSLPRDVFNNQPGSSFTFKTRRLGDSETIASRILRLWSVGTAWFWA